MQNVSVVRNSAADGGAFEVAKQEGSNLFPTMLLVNVRTLPPHRSHCSSRACFVILRSSQHGAWARTSTCCFLPIDLPDYRTACRISRDCIDLLCRILS